MAFLDNSGDIILDAVLTDTGRMRLAKGDGSFKIVKFALADDEIDYANYDKDHASGSAYFDLNIMLTPVLEALTNNGSTMNSKLISYSRTDHLYLPIIKLNEQTVSTSTVNQVTDGQGTFFVSVDESTTSTLTNTSNAVFGKNTRGLIVGNRDISSVTAPQFIQLDQGIDNSNKPKTKSIDSDLKETSYIIQMDNRFGKIISQSKREVANVSFIDDDNIATYYFSLGTDADFVEDLNAAVDANDNTSPLAGSRGTSLKFAIRSSEDLESSTFLFTEVGGGNTVTIDSVSYYYIDSNVRIHGATTGYMVDVPVRFLKKV